MRGTVGGGCVGNELKGPAVDMTLTAKVLSSPCLL